MIAGHVFITVATAVVVNVGMWDASVVYVVNNILNDCHVIFMRANISCSVAILDPTSRCGGDDHIKKGGD
jgi:hypothetical protein